MPEKEGSDEKKDAKAVVNRKQKQMMNQEQLDLSSVAESFGGQIIGKPVELDETPALLAIPAVKYGVPAAIAIGAAGYDSYQKLRGKKGILPDLSGVVKGVYDKARGVFLSKQTQTDDEKQRQRRKVIDDIINNPDRLRNVNRKKKNISTNTEKPSKEDIERLKEIPKKKKINQDQDQQQSKPPEFDPKKQPETNNKTLKNLVKIGGAGAGVTGVAGIVNKLRKDQSQKQDKKIPTITKTKTKTGKSGKLPSIKFPGTAHIVGRRSNPQ